MSNEKQDLINHRLTATACKNYTDKEIKKSEDRIISFLSRNTVDTIDHTNELAYQITAPSGAKLLQLQAIGGNSVKYEPSVASDDTIALVKTMPATVYDLDVNKVKGVSVNYNQLIPNGNFASSSGWGYYLCSFTVLNNICSFTATERYGQIGYKNINIIENHKYLCTCQLKLTTASKGIGFCIRNKITGTPTVKASSTETTNWQTLSFIQIGDTQYNGISFVDNRASDWDEIQVKNVMIFDLTAMGIDTTDVSTATTELLKRGIDINTYQEYDSGSIRNLELSGLKVEGANKCNEANIQVGFYNDKGEHDSNPICRTSDLIEVKEGETYTAKLIMGGSSYSMVWTAWDSNGRFLAQSTLASLTIRSGVKYVRIRNYLAQDLTNKSVGDFNFMLNRGSNALPYADYVHPTTTPIDLTSIVDSSGNKLFEDGSLKGINDVYDEITPYKAVKRFGIVDLGTLDYTYFSTNDGSLFRAKLVNISKNNLICSKYPKSSYENRYQYSIYYNEGAEALDILDNAYTDATAFKQAMSGVYLVYELATPIEADIDLSQLKNIQGHSNGSITALNTYDMAVPSEIRYNSIIQETLCTSVSVEGANKYNKVIVQENCYYKDTNEKTSNPDFDTYSFEAKPNTSYTISGISQASTTPYFLAYNGDTFISALMYYKSGTFTTPSNTTKVIYPIRKTEKDNEIMINEGSIALPYRPYKETITRNLPTITSDGYGVNANAHNLRVFSDYEGNEVNKRYTNVNKDDIGDYNWSYNNVYNRFYAKIQDFPQVPQRTIDLLANNYTAKTNSEGIDVNWDMVIYNGNLDNGVYIHDHRYNDAIIFKIAKSGEPMYYPLADTSKTETDLDSFDYFFDVEEGDTITFNNTYAQQVYATYSFIVKEVKSNE